MVAQFSDHCTYTTENCGLIACLQIKLCLFKVGCMYKTPFHKLGYTVTSFTPDKDEWPPEQPKEYTTLAFIHHNSHPTQNPLSHAIFATQLSPQVVYKLAAVL